MASINFTTWDHIEYEQCGHCIHVTSSFGDYKQIGGHGFYTFTDIADEAEKQWFQDRTQEIIRKVYNFLEWSFV